MTETEYNELARYMRETRTTTQAEVDETTRQHDVNDFTASERHATWGV